jgi:hypothetical protein
MGRLDYAFGEEELMLFPDQARDRAIRGPNLNVLQRSYLN